MFSDGIKMYGDQQIHLAKVYSNSLTIVVYCILTFKHHTGSRKDILLHYL